MSAQPMPGQLIQSFNIIRDANGLGAIADSSEIARRLAACWNACEGLDTDKLKRMPAPFAQMLNFGFMELWEQYTTLKEQRAELLEALKACDEAMAYMSEYDIPLHLPFRVKAAIAKATGGAA